MASLGWFVVNGQLMEVSAEGPVPSQWESWSQERPATAEPGVEPSGQSPLPLPPRDAASTIPIQPRDARFPFYAGMSSDGLTEIWSNAEGTRIFYDARSGSFFGLPGAQVVQPLPSIPGPAPKDLALLPPFIGGQLGRVVFGEERNRQSGGIRFGTLPMVVWEGKEGEFD